MRKIKLLLLEKLFNIAEGNLDKIHISKSIENSLHVDDDHSQVRGEQNLEVEGVIEKQDKFDD